jgi:CheY-like chemotaxis protein
MTLILVIDDDQSVRSALRTLLESRGIDVLLAENGAIGIGYLETFAIDAVIVDIMMPDMDGLEVIRTLNQRAPRVPVIVVSGFLSGDRYCTAPDFLRMAGGLGATVCLRKPFRPNDVMMALEACLGAPLAAPGHDANVISTGERIDGHHRNIPQILWGGAATKALEI